MPSAMASLDPVTRSLAIVDKALRAAFPDDFDKRCMYAAFGLRQLLQEAGQTVQIVGGQFLCLVVSPDGRQVTFQGFGMPSSAQAPEPSHYWVEAGQTLVDLGPHYLPRRSSHRAASMPLVCWSLQTSLPPFLRYKEAMRYDQNVELVATAAISKRMDDFLLRCQQESRSATGDVKLPGWQFRDIGSLQHAAQRGDAWARGAMSFVKTRPTVSLPF